jgi:hypothetical protein
MILDGRGTGSNLENHGSAQGVNKKSFTPWSVDRWGRLLAGGCLLLFTCLGFLLDNPLWFIGNITVAMNLVVTSLTGRCPVNAVLIRLGAKEREDLFMPGGVARSHAMGE